jgi:hypothetical protein
MERGEINQRIKEETVSFSKLLSLDVGDKIEKKQDLSYLSWAFAWGEFKKVYPKATHSVRHYDGKPYFFDSALGYMVFTEVSTNEPESEILEMWLPVMDGANKAMKAEPYTYKVKDWNASKRQNKTVFREKEVEAATMFDINKTIMRCLVKNLAMFGLGLYIYAGEDLPQISEEEKTRAEEEKTRAEAEQKAEADRKAGRKKIIALMKKHDIAREIVDATIEKTGKSDFKELNIEELAAVFEILEAGTKMGGKK